VSTSSRAASASKDVCEVSAGDCAFRLLGMHMREAVALHEIVTDGSGKVADFVLLDANEAFTTHTGLAREAVLGRRLLDVAPRADPRRIETLGRVALDGEAVEMSFFSETLLRHYRARAFRAGPGRVATVFEDISREKLCEDNKLLLLELQHRVKNSFGMIPSLVGISAADAPFGEASAAFEVLEARVRSVAELYSFAYSSGSSDRIRLDGYCSRVIEAMATLASRVAIRTELDDVVIPAKTAAPVGLILTEFVTNALKYAWPGRGHGSVDILLSRSAASVRLEVRDDGVGIPAGFELDSSPGTGLKLAQGLAAQIGGRIALASIGIGTLCALEFPYETGSTGPSREGAF